MGGNAQIKAMRQVAGKLRLDLAQYRELAAFAQFASDLDKATRDQLTRGRALTEVLKQPQFQPLPVEKQVAIIWAATNGHLDDVAPEKIGEFESGFYRFLESTHKKLLPAIAKEKALSRRARPQSSRRRSTPTRTSPASARPMTALPRRGPRPSAEAESQGRRRRRAEAEARRATSPRPTTRRPMD